MEIFQYLRNLTLNILAKGKLRFSIQISFNFTSRDNELVAGEVMA